jgi:phosphate:Na+ symporter
MPAIQRFTRLVERLLPDRGSALTRALDPAALASPVVAGEAVRLTVARALETLCGSIRAALTASTADRPSGRGRTAASAAEIAAALGKARQFISDVSGPPESASEQRRLTSTLHALDHASRLAELAGEEVDFTFAKGGPEDARPAKLCAEAMQNAASAVHGVAEESGLSERAAPIKSADTPEAELALARLEQSANALSELRGVHRSATLSAVGTGELAADQAMARVDAVRRLDALAHHAWRAASHLVDREE